MFALTDGNSFYASCERLFRPDLNGRPIVVLSNNDGAVVARSTEAKKLSIKMAAPYFQIAPILRQHRVAVFSSNYEFYSDVSQRLMSTISSLSPRIEVYSIDECFSDLTGIVDLAGTGRAIKERVWQWVGIPTCVGIAPSKTLAKFANHLAKRYEKFNGVCVWGDMPPAEQKYWMSVEPASELWGIGWRLREKLISHNIYTVADLYHADPALIRARYGVVVERTIRELHGLSCIELEDIRSRQEQIIRSRSFGELVSDRDSLRTAISYHISNAAEALRAQKSMAQCIGVQISTNRFRTQDRQFYGWDMVTLPVATSDTLQLNRAAQMLLNRLYRPGYLYKKAGVLLTGLSGQNCQLDMLEAEQSPRREQLMTTVDAINKRYGRQTLHTASEQLGSWAMRQKQLSPCYTTRWSDIPIAR